MASSNNLFSLELAKEFLTIVDKSPSRLRKRIHDNIRMAVEVFLSTKSH